MTTEQIKVILGEINLSKSGKKSVLINRVFDGKVDESNQISSSSRSNSKSALQEFTDLVSGSHENDEDHDDLFDLIDGWGKIQLEILKEFIMKSMCGEMIIVVLSL